MKQRKVVVLLALMIGLCGCERDTSKSESAVETQGNDKSVEISSIKMDDSKLEAEVKVEQKEDASSDMPMSGKTEETAYGNRIFIPDGFVDITEYYDGYESNNAAGGVTWTLYNEKLDMTIDISEYPYPLVYDIDGSPNQVLMGEYDFYRQSYGETELNEKEGYFVTVWSDPGNKKNKLKYIVDNICHTVTVTYPENKEQEYSAIRDKVINSFEVVGQ